MGMMPMSTSQDTVNRFFFVVVLSLAVIATLCVLGAILLRLNGEAVPEGIMTIAAAAVGSLGSLLNRPRQPNERAGDRADRRE